MQKNINWDGTAFFERLAATNRLALSEKFTFCRVSGLDGFEEALHTMQSSVAFICVSDIAQGYTELNNTPHTRRVKTVFFAMRHAMDDMSARLECMDIMRELFRQFMSVLIQERIRVEEEQIFLDPRISFQEIDRYFMSGCACAFFQVAVDVYTDLRYNAQEWNDVPTVVGHELLFINRGLASLSTVVTFFRNQMNMTLKEAKALAESENVVIMNTDDYTEELIQFMHDELLQRGCNVAIRDMIENNAIV